MYLMSFCFNKDLKAQLHYIENTAIAYLFLINKKKLKQFLVVPLDVWTPLCKLKVRPLEMRMTVTELGSSPSVKPQGAVEKCTNARSLG